MIIDLEQRQILCEERKEGFINILNRIGLASTMKCLAQEEVPRSSSSDTRMQTEEEKIEEYLLLTQKENCRQARIFTPETMRGRYTVDISQMFTDMELLKERENNKGSKPTTLEEVVDVIQSTPGCKALIEGEGGIGKTTILRHLSYNWSDQSIKLFEGKIVFLLSLRDLKKDDDISDLIVQQLTDFNLDTDLPEDPQLIKAFINKHDNSVVLLLDGLDELRFDNQSVISLFRKKRFKQSTVILTSRPENIDEFIKECDVHIRVSGFNKESIGKYIEKYFKHFENQQLGESLKEELDIDTFWPGEKHPEAYSMCKNPMLLLSICMLWEDNQSLPSDNTDLFKELFRSILNQFNKQKQCDKILKFEDTPSKYVHAMILLGKCMYINLKRNQLSIKITDLIDTHSTRDMIDMALKLGFVYEEAPLSKSNCERIFMPPHKLIVESLVGFYMSKLLESENIKDDSDVRQLLIPLGYNELDVIKSEYFKVARKFALGFLDAATAGYYLKQWLTKHFPLRMSSRIRKFFFGIKITYKERFIANILDIEPDPYGRVSVRIQNVSGDVFNNFLTECSLKQVQLALRYLFISGNNFHNIDVNSLPSLLIMCPKLWWLEMRDCNLSGDVINYLGTECSLKQVQLALDILDISNNNLHNIDGNSLSSFLIMCPKLRHLVMINCNLSGDVINHLVTECSLKQVQLPLRTLRISHNNLHSINVNSMSSLLIMCPKLWVLDMSDCNLSDEVINYLTEEHYSNRAIQF
ncbi:NACHT, LRR and PYD domains-containing protein 3-like [Antedon mediterranea]|uniref:NACHT, LRR and PYD domains-containing protein 3-like n=1 Tax=Antedon mediterranea TaxID=105859 RepID=UPI003AF58F6E